MNEAEVVQGQVDAFNVRDVDRFLSYYSADAIIEDGGGAVIMTGHDAIRGMYGALFSQSPDIHAEIPRRIHTGQWVIDEEHATGMNFEGFPPEFTASVVYQVKDGKITRVRLLL